MRTCSRFIDDGVLLSKFQRRSCLGSQKTLYRDRMFALFGGHSRAHILPNTVPADNTVVRGLGAQALQGETSENSANGSIKTLKFKSCASFQPHPEKIHYGGEDAFFISEYAGGAIGVSDGVGGWQETGVNPAEYSRVFMRTAREYVECSGIFSPNVPGEAQHRIDPRGALEASHKLTKLPGSATGCVMQLDQMKMTLEAANLGDSGFLIIRDSKAFIKSRSLQHFFDCPLQFGAYPEYVEATDTADMADIYSIPLVPGDIIVAGTDGLWDNCYESEIINLAPDGEDGLQAAAQALVKLAQQHAGDEDFLSPYVRDALAQGIDLPWWEKLAGIRFRNGGLQLKQLSGGKMDDITVVVSLVQEYDQTPQSPPSSVPLSEAGEQISDGAPRSSDAPASDEPKV